MATNILYLRHRALMMAGSKIYSLKNYVGTDFSIYGTEFGETSATVVRGITRQINYRLGKTVKDLTVTFNDGKECNIGNVIAYGKTVQDNYRIGVTETGFENVITDGKEGYLGDVVLQGRTTISTGKIIGVEEGKESVTITDAKDGDLESVSVFGKSVQDFYTVGVTKTGKSLSIEDSKESTVPTVNINGESEQDNYRVGVTDESIITDAKDGNLGSVNIGGNSYQENYRVGVTEGKSFTDAKDGNLGNISMKGKNVQDNYVIGTTEESFFTDGVDGNLGNVTVKGNSEIESYRVGQRNGKEIIANESQTFSTEITLHGSTEQKHDRLGVAEGTGTVRYTEGKDNCDLGSVKLKGNTTIDNYRIGVATDKGAVRYDNTEKFSNADIILEGNTEQDKYTVGVVGPYDSPIVSLTDSKECDLGSIRLEGNTTQDRYRVGVTETATENIITDAKDSAIGRIKVDGKTYQDYYRVGVCADGETNIFNDGKDADLGGLNIKGVSIQENYRVGVIEDISTIFKDGKDADLGGVTIKGKTYCEEYINYAGKIPSSYHIESVGENERLENLIQYKSVDDFCNISAGNVLINDGYISLTAFGDWCNAFYSKNLNKIKPSTKYTLICNIVSNTINAGDVFINQGVSSECLIAEDCTVNPGQTGLFKWLVTSKDTSVNKTHVIRTFLSNNATSGSVKFKCLLLEGDWTESEVPETITEGVKYPIKVTSRGKNLWKATSRPFTVSERGLWCDVYGADDMYTWKIGNSVTKQLFKAGTKVRLTVDKSSLVGLSSVSLISVNESFVVSPDIVTTIPRDEYFIIRGFSEYAGEICFGNILVEEIVDENNLPQPVYEPYKVSSEGIFLDAPLRSLPNGVCDEYNPETGTEIRRIMKYQLDPDADWSFDNNQFICNPQALYGKIKESFKGNMSCNTLPVAGYSDIDNSVVDQGICYLYYLRVRVKEFGDNIELFKQWLRNNPTYILCEFKTPIITYREPSKVLKQYSPYTKVYTDNKVQPILSAEYLKAYSANPKDNDIIAPSSNYPSELHTVGEYDSGTGKYKVEITSNGKNLIKEFKHGAISSVTGEESPGSANYISNYIKLNYQQVQASIISGISPNYTLFISFYDKDLNPLGRSWAYMAGVTSSSTKFLLNTIYNNNGIVNNYTNINDYSNMVSYVRVFIYSIKEGFKESMLSNIQLEISPVETSFEPYKESTITYLLDEPLRSIDDNIKDTIEDGKLIRRVGKYTFTGDEYWWDNTAYPESTYRKYQLSDLTVNKPSVVNGKFACDNMKQILVRDADSLYTEGLASGPNGYSYMFILHYTTADSLEAFIKWLKRKNITIFYELAEPVITDIQPIDNTTLRQFSPYTRIYSYNTYNPLLTTEYYKSDSATPLSTDIIAPDKGYICNIVDAGYSLYPNLWSNNKNDYYDSETYSFDVEDDCVVINGTGETSDRNVQYVYFGNNGIKENTIYTVICTVEENTLSQGRFNVNGETKDSYYWAWSALLFGQYSVFDAGETGTKMFIARTAPDTDKKIYLRNYIYGYNKGCRVKYKIQIIEGDIRDFDNTVHLTPDMMENGNWWKDGTISNKGYSYIRLKNEYTLPAGTYRITYRTPYTYNTDNGIVFLNKNNTGLSTEFITIKYNTTMIYKATQPVSFYLQTSTSNNPSNDFVNGCIIEKLDGGLYHHKTFNKNIISLNEKGDFAPAVVDSSKMQFNNGVISFGNDNNNYIMSKDFTISESDSDYVLSFEFDYSACTKGFLWYGIYFKDTNIAPEYIGDYTSTSGRITLVVPKEYLPNTINIRFYCYYYPEALKISKIQFEKGSSPSEFSASKSVISLNEKGDFTPANILDSSKMQFNNGVISFGNDNDKYIVSKDFTISESESDYVLSFDFDYSACTKGRLWYGIYFKDFRTAPRFIGEYTNSSGRITLVVPKEYLPNTMNIRFYCYGNPEALKISKIQFERGSSPSTFSTSKTSSISTILSEPLRSLPNGIKDTYDIRTGVEVRRVGRLLLNGTENWEEHLVRNGISTFVVRDIPNLKGSANTINTVCDKFVSANDVDYGNSPANTICANDVNWIWIKVKEMSISDFKQLLAENPVTLYYQLLKPSIINHKYVPEQTVLKQYLNATLVANENINKANIVIEYFRANNTSVPSTDIVAPAPAYPSELLSVGAAEKDSNGKYPVTVKLTGKNIFNAATMNVGYTTVNGDIITINATDAKRYYAIIPVIPNKKYTITIERVSETVPSGNSVICNGNIGYINSDRLAENNELTQGTKLTRTITPTKNFISLCGWGTWNNVSVRVQLELGTKATDYEPYKEQTKTYLLDEPLRSIGDVHDTIEDGKLIRRIHSITINGTKQRWAPNNTNNFDISRFFTTVKIDDKYEPETEVNDGDNNIIQTINSNLKTALRWSNFDKYSLYANYNIDNKSIAFFLNNFDIPQNTDSIKSYMDANPIQFQYVLKNPIITDLVEDDSNELINICTDNIVTSNALVSPIITSRYKKTNNAEAEDTDIYAPLPTFPVEMKNPGNEDIDEPDSLWIAERGRFSNISPEVVVANGYVTVYGTGTWCNAFYQKPQSMKPNTKYTIICQVIENTLDDIFYALGNTIDNYWIWKEHKCLSYKPNETGIKYCIRTSLDDISQCGTFARTHTAVCSKGKCTFRMVILEGEHPDFAIKAKFALESRGKNILDLYSLRGTYTNQGITFTNNGNDTFTFKRSALDYESYAPILSDNSSIEKALLKGGRYRLYMSGEEYDNTTCNIRISYRKCGENVTSFITADGRPFDVPANSIFEDFNCYVPAGTVTAKYCIRLWMVEDGDDYETYSKYSVEQDEVILNEPLRSLPNGVHDEYDYRTGREIRRVGKYVCTSDETFSISHSTDPDVTRIYTRIANAKTENLCVLSNTCETVDWRYIAYEVTERALIGTYQNYVGFNIPEIQMDYSVENIKKWFEKHPTTVYYELAKPVITYHKSISEQSILKQHDIGYIECKTDIAPNMSVEYYKSDNASESDTDFITPTADYTDKLMSVGTTEKDDSEKYPVTVKVTGKNIFDKNNVTVLRNAWLGGLSEGKICPVSRDSYESTIAVRVKPNTNYVITKACSYRFRLGISDSEVLELGTECKLLNSYNSPTEFKFTTTENTKLLLFSGFCAPPANEEITEQELYDSIQIEEGTVATSYEVYKEQTKTYLLDEPLRSVGNVHDTIEDGKLIRRVGYKVLNGDEEWTASSYSTKGVSHTFFTKINVKNYASNNVISDNLKQISGSPIPTFMIDNPGYCMINSDTTSSTIDGNLLISLDPVYVEFNSLSSLAEYLKRNPIAVQYELNTPVVTNLEQMKLNSYEGATNVTTVNKTQAVIDLKYKKTYNATVEETDLQAPIANFPVDINSFLE